ncbi:hypothetical protein quinque_013391 [Culex quinquefasciatus]
MPRKCIVLGCDTNRHYYEHGVRFFAFPPAEYVEQRDRWRQLVGRDPDWRIPTLSCVCQRHFRPEELPTERKLPVEVVPSVNLPTEGEVVEEPEPAAKRQRVTEKVVHIEIVANEGCEEQQIVCKFCGKQSAYSEELAFEVLRRNEKVREEIWDLCWTDDGDEGNLCYGCWHKMVEFEIFVELCRQRQAELHQEEYLQTDEEEHEVEQVLLSDGQEQDNLDEEFDELPQLAGLTVEEMIEELDKIPPRTVKNSGVVVDNECWDCGESFPNVNQKKEHRKNCKLKGTPDSLRKQGFECEVCHKTMSTRAGYRNHLVKIHSEKLEGGYESCPEELLRLQSRKRLKCPLCQSQFHQLYMLKYHLRTHQVKQQNDMDGPRIKMKDRDSTCKICGKTFAYPPYLEKHMKFHLKVRDYQCDLCDKAFYLKQDLQNHKNSVHLKHCFLCPVCGKSFGTKKYLDRHHRQLHEAPREDLKCPHCSKQMSCPVALRYHVMTHTGEKNHRCGVCGAAFRMRYELTQHRIKVHRERIEGVKLYKQQQQQKGARRKVRQEDEQVEGDGEMEELQVD